MMKLSRVLGAIVLGVTAFAVSAPVPFLQADEKTKEKTKEKSKEGEKEGKKGTVTGVVTKVGEKFLEVKVDGEERPRQFFPHWRGGANGGLDKDMLKQIKETPEKARVRIEWTFEERPRIEKLEILKKS